jgi:dienelactone hydrolase
MRATLISAILLAGVAIAAPAAALEVVVNIPTRGNMMPVLVDAPDNAKAAVVLLAGGAGRLDITPAGRIGSLGGNQLVRTRSAYARAGFIAATPDLPGDFKRPDGGVRDAYRWSPEHAADLGALVEYLRHQAPRVYLVGTSRAALSVANAAARLSGAQKPDAIVITSGMLMQTDPRQPSVQRMVKPESITMPVLLVAHENDACIYTPASATPQFKSLLTRAPRVDIVMLKGGEADKKGEECEAAGHHGFAGLDQVVVDTIAGWLKALP